ncbi:MAG TPA: TolC family protein [Gemmatimonadaceae bacterium]|nr:TolC family protein [Gemmatimonadaceae bacterium]
MRLVATVLAAIAWGVQPAAALAQDSTIVVHRADAVHAALAHGALMGLARADTTAALADLLTARALENPRLTAGYTRSEPQYHVEVEQPLPAPWARSPRVAGARAARAAARYRFALATAEITLAADTLYTRALAAAAHATLSRRTADQADTLRRIAVARRDAGDASDLDVELATISAGQAANVAASDSLEAFAAMLELQAAMGVDGGAVVIALADSLGPPPSDSAGAAAPAGAPLRVAAAEASVEAARLTLRSERRSVWGAPSVSAGFETGDPSGEEPGLLPTVGIAFSLPLLNGNRGPITTAEADEARARAELASARVESAGEIARAERARATAFARLERARALVDAANRVAGMALTAYREGAESLASVLEAQRNARDVLADYVDALAAAWIARATLRVVTLTPGAAAAP